MVLKRSPGCWSPTELTGPGECFIYNACPGSIGERAEFPALFNADGSRVTSQCNEKDGYEGQFCSECRKDYYKSSHGQCLPCATDNLGEVSVLSAMVLRACTLSVSCLTSLPPTRAWAPLSLSCSSSSLRCLKCVI